MDKIKYVEFVYQIVEIFTSPKSFEETCQTVVNLIPSSLGFLGAVLFLLDEKKEYIYPYNLSQNEIVRRSIELFHVNISKMKISLKDKENLSVRAVLDKKYYISSDYRKFAPPQAKALARPIQKFSGMRNSVAFPIEYKDEVLVILLISTAFDNFKTEDIQVLKIFSHIAGGAIKNWLLSHQLEEKLLSLEKSNMFKTELLEMSSHELRTPATMIRDALSMIKDYSDNDLYLYYAKMAASRQLLLINNILNSSMIESNAFELYKSRFNINELVRKISKELEVFLIDKDVEMELDMDGPIIIRADHEKISQVLYNLLYNAIKFTQKGSVKVQTRKEGDKVKVLVRDTGVGINSKEKKLIFNKYHKTNKSTFGNGIGLYISKYIIDAHLGTLFVESKYKRGSTFSFSLPID